MHSILNIYDIPVFKIKIRGIKNHELYEEKHFYMFHAKRGKSILLFFHPFNSVNFLF